jgi:hypothetical protein
VNASRLLLCGPFVACFCLTSALHVIPPVIPKVVVRRPDTGEWAEQAEAEAAWESQPNGGARPSRDGGSSDGGGTGEGRAGSEEGAEEEEDGGGYQGATNAALRDVFGDDDDDI